jgi:hypothetical protein
MDIDMKLNEFGSWQITNFKYIVGDYLFDAIAHLLKYSTSSNFFYRNSMKYLWNCLELGVLKALECHRHKLN